jgi:hypothetical protein
MTGTRWAAIELDPERVVAELARRFPGVPAWWGEYTGSWWAMLRERNGRDRLVEAKSPGELCHRLEEALRTRSVPRYARPAPAVRRPPPSRPPRAGSSTRRPPPRRRSFLRRLLAW